MNIYYRDSHLGSHAFQCVQCKCFAQHHTYELVCWAGNLKHMHVNLVRHVCAMCNYSSVDAYTVDSAEPLKYGFYRLYPENIPSSLPSPNADLPDECLSVYKEAAFVFVHSPRAAAALLRLCLQLLLEHCGCKSPKENINDAIGRAVASKVIPEHIGAFMDYVRVKGNDAAHGNDFAINPDEQRENAEYMFILINEVAKALITLPREGNESIAKLPESIRQHIAVRNAKAAQKKQEP